MVVSKSRNKRLAGISRLDIYAKKVEIVYSAWILLRAKEARQQAAVHGAGAFALESMLEFEGKPLPPNRLAGFTRRHGSGVSVKDSGVCRAGNDQTEVNMDQKEIDLLEKLAPTDYDVKRLWDDHQQYEKELQELEGKSFLTPAEEQRVRDLKKQKLDGKTKLVALLESKK